MAPAVISTGHIGDGHVPSVGEPNPLTPRIEKPTTIDELTINLAQTIPNETLISYPTTDLGVSDFTNHTAKELDLFADEAAKELSNQGLRPRASKSNVAEVVALLGPSNIEYFMSILALTRMGFAILFLSTRLSTEAYVALLQKTNCNRIVRSAKLDSAVANIHEIYPVENFSIPDRGTWAVKQPSSPPFQRETELIDEVNTVSFIVHSSGSTGLPKPISMTHQQALNNFIGSGMSGFLTTPFFHNHGLATVFRGMVSGKRTAVYNANLPLTNSNLVAAMRAANAESFHCVPYVLKLLSETTDGVKELAKAKLVSFGGSSCPDDLGDMLVANGVNLVAQFGATEVGQLLSSRRDPKTDKAWNYLRPYPKAKPHLLFEEISEGTGIFEMIALDGLPTKSTSNSNNPPNSFRTQDTFVKHPTIPNAWKFIGRIDDRVNLVTGEKVLPIPYEHRIRQNKLVQECLVFGTGQAFPGLLIFPSESSVGMSSDDILETLWSIIQDANMRAEAFGRVPREMVQVMPAGTKYPHTDKGTIIRAASYKQFETVIQNAYQRFESPGSSNRLTLDLPELEEYLLKLLTERVGVDVLDLETDFFTAGMDSLQAITSRAYILRELDLGGESLTPNIIFENPNVAKLATYLHALQTGSSVRSKNNEDIMQELVTKYSDFKAFKGGDRSPDSEVVLLTGATGSLGAHLLSQLLALPRISHVYCLVRAGSPSHARQRIIASLSARGLALNDELAAKFTTLPSDLSLADLGLGQEIYHTISSSITSVIHAAWAVNFTWDVSSFEAQHIAGLYHLLNLCLSVPFSRPARLAFISSISVAAGTSGPATISETHVRDPAQAQNTGYGQSKWVAEHIVHTAATNTGIEAYVLRTGQIIGDSVMGYWNPSEAIPLMFRAATTIGALPALQESASWLPVDICAQAITQISRLTDKSSLDAPFDPNVVFNVVNPVTISWTQDILPTLAKAGLQFETVDQRNWVQLLRDGEQNPKLNPTVKLLGFYADKYDDDKEEVGDLVFETTDTAKWSSAIKDGYDVLSNALLEKCLDNWKKDWS